MFAKQRRPEGARFGAGGTKRDARYLHRPGRRVVERHDEPPVAVRRQVEHSGHVRYETERDAPLLCLMKEVLGGSVSQGLTKRGADLVDAFVRVHPGDRSVALVFGDVLASEELAQHAPLRARQGVDADDSVRRRQHAACAGARTDAGIALRGDAPVLVQHRRNLGTGENRLLHAHVDMVAPAMAHPAEHGKLCCGGRERAGQGLR